MLMLSYIAGLTAKIMQTMTMGDVYGAFFDFSKMLADKVKCQLQSFA
jgi:hypothetical protein